MLDLVTEIADFVLRIDQHLAVFLASYGRWGYGAIFVIVFAVTGVVVTPLLPGNTLLFAAGALCAQPGSGLALPLLAGVVWAAAVLGNAANYWLGARLGRAVLRRDDSVIVRRRHLERMQAYFASRGSRTLVWARFVPLARTFVPFAAGVTRMGLGRFFLASIAGGFLWSSALLLAGHAAGSRPAFQGNLPALIAVLVLVSLLPLAWVGWRVWSTVRRERSAIP